MKRFLKIIAILVGIGAVAVLAVMFLTSGAREVARTFVIDASSGNFEGAQTGMHPELAKQVPLEALQQMFATADAYTDVSFSSVEASGGRTTLSGTATTAANCVSTVDMVLLKSQIISFNIEPLCSK